MLSDNTSIKKNFLFNSILTVSNIIFPILTFPYISRVLGPEGTGKISFATSVVYYFNLFAQLGIPTYGIRSTSQVRDDKEGLARLVKELLIINCLLSLVSYALLAVSLHTIEKLNDEKMLIGIISMSIFLNSIGVEWLYKGSEQYEYITKRSILFKLIAVIMMFCLVRTPSDHIIYGGITIFASSASNILNFLYLKKQIGSHKHQKLDIKRHFKAIGIFFSMSIATTLYTNLDTLMLEFMKGSIEVGYYDAAIKIRKMLLGFVTALGTVILPRASYYVHCGMMERFYEISKKALEAIAILSSAVVGYFIMYAYDSVIFLSGAGYHNAILPMKIVMPTVFLAGITNILGIQMLIPLGKENVVLYSELMGGMTDLILNAALIPFFSSAGAAIGTLSAEVVVFVVQALYLYKAYGFSIFSLPWMKIWTALFPAMIVGGLFSKIEGSSFVRLVISVIPFFAIYAGMLLILKEQLIVGASKQFLDEVKRRKNEKD